MAPNRTSPCSRRDAVHVPPINPLFHNESRELMNMKRMTTKAIVGTSVAAFAAAGLLASAGVAQAELAGPGCASYAAQNPFGPASVTGMAQDPVAVAASNNPVLKTLTAAVSGTLNPKVNLVDTLNGGDFTVFAPTDDAFGKLPKATVKLLGTPKGAKTLTTVPTYHVVAGQMNPSDIAGKTLKTVEGEKLKISGSADMLKAQKANV